VHAGDMLWHGGWWDVGAAHGPVDFAFLPANGVEVDYPHLQPAVNIPAVMTPEQAVEAARALKARTLVPIHYNRTFEHAD
jgi:L-ascorbate metabolism protein UlaG (beta-lactamase superfamily)